MKIAEKVKNFVQSKEDEQDTIIIRGVKYKSIENGWVPISNAPTIKITDIKN